MGQDITNMAQPALKPKTFNIGVNNKELLVVVKHGVIIPFKYRVNIKHG
ncbi:hypothetical protein CVS40_3349 [Lucilia cuprina]|nr:hypothetical protein CVS40_3349 [Lucilia cuprina]